jgi:hypothetical protein
VQEEFFQAAASARKIVTPVYVFAYKWACASGEAALARALQNLSA